MLWGFEGGRGSGLHILTWDRAATCGLASCKQPLVHAMEVKTLQATMEVKILLLCSVQTHTQIVSRQWTEKMTTAVRRDWRLSA